MMKMISLLFTLVLFYSAQTLADDLPATLSLNPEHVPPAFKISYEITKGGIVLGHTEAVWQPATSKHWIYRWNTQPQGIAKLFIDEMTQQSTFEIYNNSLRVVRYQNTQKDRNQEIRFDWDRLIANSEYKDDEESLSISENTYDELGFHILIMTNIANLPEQFSVPVIRKNRSTIYEFDTTTSNPIETSAGKFEVLLLERQKDDEEQTTHRIWVAKTHSGIPIRYEKLENGKREYAAQITGFQWQDSSSNQLISQTIDAARTSSSASNGHSIQ